MVLEAILLGLKDGLNYWVYTEIILDYIIKLCSKDKKFVICLSEIFSKNKSVYKLIENWIKES